MDLKRYLTVGILSVFAISIIVTFQNCGQKEPVDLSGGGGSDGCTGANCVQGTDLKLSIYNGTHIEVEDDAVSVSASQAITVKIFNGGAHPIVCVGVNEDCIPNIIMDEDGDCVSEHSSSEYDTGRAWLYNVNEGRCDRGYEHTILGTNNYRSTLGNGVWVNVLPAGELSGAVGKTLYYNIKNSLGQTVKKTVAVVE